MLNWLRRQADDLFGRSGAWANVSGTWKETSAWVNVAGVWKEAAVWQNVNGTWKN